MDGVDVGDLGGADDGWDVEIAAVAARGPDAHLLIGQADVQRAGVHIRVDSHGFDPEFAASGDHPDGDLAPVGYQHFSEHGISPDGR